MDSGNRKVTWIALFGSGGFNFQFTSNFIRIGKNYFRSVILKSQYDSLQKNKSGVYNSTFQLAQNISIYLFLYSYI